MNHLAQFFCGCLLLILGTAAQGQFISSPDCPVTPAMPSNEVIRDTMTKATDRGFLWRVEKNGKVAHLFGTIHIGQFEWMFPGPQLRQALIGAKAIALELNPMSADNQQYFAQNIRSGAAPVPEQLAPSLFQVAKNLCIEENVISQVNQEGLIGILTLASARKMGLYADYGSEVFLAGLAFGTKKPVIELENAALQSGVLKAALGDDPQWRILSEWLNDFAAGKSIRLLQRMTTAWNTSDFATFETYSDWCECLITDDDKRRWRLMNDDRNDNLAQRIALEHEKSDGPILAAIGTLHFTGPKAVQKLLAEKGFAVTQIIPTRNQR
jgi:uncharacterized protein